MATPQHTRRLQTYYQSTRNLAIKCSLTIRVNIAVDTAGHIDWAVLSLGQCCWGNDRNYRGNYHEYVGFRE